MTDRGPTLRTDVAELYIAQVDPSGVRMLQLRRANAPMLGTWQPVMGHAEPGETALATVVREALEETALMLDASATLFALEQAPPYFLAERNEIMIAPRFLAIVDAGFAPTLNEEHTDARWIDPSSAAAWFWPSQRVAAAEALEICLDPGTPTAQALRVELG